MLATLLSATLHGLDGRFIRVEVDVAPGLPGFTIVGLPDAALQEARERVRGAIRNSGFAYPPRRITVNLAPADLRKGGASLDLAIAAAILLGSEQVRAGGRWALVGELSLGGEVRAVPGILPMVTALARRGVRRIVVPGRWAGGGTARDRRGGGPGGHARRGDGPAPIHEVPAWIAGRRGPLRDDPRRRVAGRPIIGIRARSAGSRCAGSRRGAWSARGAARLEIALAGGHGLLLVGPPGAGKTLLARTVPGLLPPLGDAEALAATIVESVAAETPILGLVRRAPFRAPHHTISYAGMVGGGPRLSPGEVTMASQRRPVPRRAARSSIGTCWRRSASRWRTDT